MTDDNNFIASLFPEEVRTYLVNTALTRGVLYPEEEALIRNVVPKRRREFTAGRLCARRALAQLAITGYPLLAGEDREPLWPEGIVGSISHTGKYCGVAVARKSEIESVGLDIECVGSMDGFGWKQVCNPEELSRVGSLPAPEQKGGLALVFSAKECFYKFQHAINGQWLDFHDVAVSADSEKGDFEVTVLVETGNIEKGAVFKGMYLFHDGYVFTGMSMKASRQ